jgi:hypothetical protein
MKKERNDRRPRWQSTIIGGPKGREHHRVETRCAPSVISGVIPSGPECVGRLCEGRGGIQNGI